MSKSVLILVFLIHVHVATVEIHLVLFFFKLNFARLLLVLINPFSIVFVLKQRQFVLVAAAVGSLRHRRTAERRRFDGP